MEEKRKRGRPRKIIPDEIEKIVQINKELKEKEEQEYHQIVLDIKKQHTNQNEWDYPLGAEIPYFDATKSYELTGYKPIDKTHGLNFDPTKFTGPANTYRATQKYCQYAQDSKSYREFWQKQYDYCNNGLTIDGYTITGDHYYFLNFYRLEDLTSATKAGGGPKMHFPKFFVAQYEYFHYIELCKKLRKDAIGLKARGVNKPALS